MTRQGRPGWLAAGLIFGLWALIALLSASQIYLRSSARGDPLAWDWAVAWQLAVWLPYALLTPVILWLARRLPISRHDWVRPAAVHAALGTISAFSYLAVFTVIDRAFQGRSLAWPAYLAGLRSSLLIRLYLDFLMYWAILAVGLAVEYYRRYRERELHALYLESQLAQAQLQALRMQIHPHFLFNTLHAVVTLVRSRDSRAAIRTLTRLSDLLRHTLDSIDRHEVTLEEELEFIERYLEIEQIRLQDRLRVRTEIETETLSALVPNLVLQPLVENAVRHGIGGSVSAGLIEIKATRAGGMLRLEVADDGPGLGGARWTGHGMGISTTRARLRQLYGKRQQFEIRERHDARTVATVHIPYRVQPGSEP